MLFHLVTLPASEMYGVPRTTLKDRLSGRVVHGTKPGPKPYLCHSEERELVDHLKKLSDLGMAKTRREVLCIAEIVAVNKGMLRRGQISGGWWRRFLERNPGTIYYVSMSRRCDSGNSHGCH